MKSKSIKLEVEQDLPVPTFADLPYGDDPRNVMDVWLAVSVEPVPCVMYIHPGGWVSGDKSMIQAWGGVQTFLDKGISVVSINYRYLPQTIIETYDEYGTASTRPRSDYQEAPVQVPNYDAARALQFIRSRANQWGIVSERIAVAGGSAGGCTALWLAFHDDLADPDSDDVIARESTRVWCAAVVGAQTTLAPNLISEWTPNCTYGGHAFGYIWNRNDSSMEFRSFLEDWESVKDWIDEYSPEALLKSGAPPIYLYYRDTPEKGKNQADPAHSSNFGSILIEKLEVLGVEYEFVHAGVKAPRYKDSRAYLIHMIKR